MNTDALFTDLQDALLVHERIYNTWKDEIAGFVARKDATADEFLLQEILSEILEYIRRTADLIRYVGKDVCRSGELSTDSQGNILLDGQRIPPMEEFEVYLYDEIAQKMVWKRTFVTISAQRMTPRLAGLENSMPINGVKARARW